MGFRGELMAKPVFTVVLDKLVLLLDGTIPLIDNLQQSGNTISDCKLSDVVILRKNNKQKHPSFYNCYDVLLNSKLFGQLFYNYNGKYRFSVDTPILLQVENYMLYADGLTAKLTLLLQNLPEVSFYNYQYIDIAIDGHDLVSKHETFVTSKQYQRKANIKNISIIFDDRNKEQIGYTVGSKQSDKHVGIYRKQAEIIFSGKNYISAFWCKNGLLPLDGKSIDRVEGRLTANELTYFSSDFKDLENPAYIAGFFKLKFENFLVFHKRNNHKDRRHLINWNQLKSVTIKKEKTTAKATDSLYSKRITIHTLFDEYLVSGDIQILHSFLKFTRGSNLIPWVSKKINGWKRDLRY